MPESLTEIGSNCFLYALNEHLRLPEQCKIIGEHSFSNCQALKEIDLRNVETILPEAFSKCRAVSEIIVPESLTEMLGAFNDIDALQTVWFANRGGKSMKTFYAFRNCPKLREIHVSDKLPFTLNERIIDEEYLIESINVPALTLYVPAGSVDAYKADKFWGQFGAILEEGASVEKVEYDIENKISWCVSGLQLQVNAHDNVDVKIYTPAGGMVAAKSLAAGEEYSIDLEPGNYILNAGDIAEKIAVK